MLSSIDRSIQWIGQQSGWLYVIVSLLTILETVLRAVFGAPTIWTLELSLMLAGVAYLINGVSFPQATGHIRIDLFHKRLYGWRRKLADTISVVVASTYLGVIVWWGLDQAIPSLLYGERSGSGWNSPLPIIHKVAIPVAGLLILVALLCQVLGSFLATRHSSSGQHR